MAKMFYTMEEACEKLGKTPEQVKDMVNSGQVQEFRDRDKLMFKVDQIDLLAGADDEPDDEITLEMSDSDTDSALDLSSGSGIDLKEESSLGLADSGEGTGISVFDSDPGQTQPSDTAADTQVTETIDEELSLEAVGSGSGLLDLTQESDDTTLGAELLEEVYAGGDDAIDIPTTTSGLFDETGAESPGDQMGPATVAQPGAAAAAMVPEAYDGGGSGLGVGMMIGAMCSLIVMGVIIAATVSGATSQLALTFAEQLYIYTGALAGIVIICGIIGFFIGKASE